MPIIPQFAWACNAQLLGGGAQPLCIAAPRTIPFFAKSCDGDDLPIKRKRRADRKRRVVAKYAGKAPPRSIPPLHDRSAPFDRGRPRPIAVAAPVAPSRCRRLPDNRFPLRNF